MPVSFATDTVVVVRPGWRTERGDLIADWSTAVEHTVTGCRVQPLAGEELLFSGGQGGGGTGRDARVTRWKLFAPAGADVVDLDRVRWGGDLYEVDGPVLDWASPTGMLAHREATLKRVEG